MVAKKCAGKNKDGSACRGYAGKASKFCFQHDPKQAKARSAARKAGGRANKTPHSKAKAPGMVRDMPGVMELIDYVLAEALVLQNSLERGRLLVSIVGSYSSALQVGDMERRISDLEESIYGNKKH